MVVGVALALDYVVSLPTSLVAAALAVGAVSIAAFFAGVWSYGRATGVGWFRAAGRAIWATIRLVVDLL